MNNFNQNKPTDILQDSIGIWDAIQSVIKTVDIQEDEKENFLNKVKDTLANNEVNVLVTGVTGAGKSTTIDAFFDKEVCKIGHSPDPETKHIQKYNFHNLVLWDTPGFGDSPENDNRYAQEIVNLLRQDNKNGLPKIDLVLVIVDGSSRDLGTTYELITKVIAPNMRYRDGLIIAVNQADMAMKGRGWDSNAQKPMPELQDFLNQKAESVKARINNSCGLNAKVMYYSALYKYNLLKLLCFILDNVPNEEKIINILSQINRDQQMWESHDEDVSPEYVIEKAETSISKVMSYAAKGAEIGGKIGRFIPIVGETVGKVIGGTLGAIAGLFF